MAYDEFYSIFLACSQMCLILFYFFGLKPLPECEAKHKFAAVMDLWRRIRRTHKSSNPTTAVVDDYPNLVKQFLTLLDKDFPWFKPLPNQFHRLTHSSYFMNNDRNALGVKYLEGLEKEIIPLKYLTVSTRTRGTGRRPTGGCSSY